MDLSKLAIGAKARFSEGIIATLVKADDGTPMWDAPGDWWAHVSDVTPDAILPCEATLTIGSEWKGSDGQKWTVRGLLSDRFHMRVLAESEALTRTFFELDGKGPGRLHLLELWTDPPKPRTWEVAIVPGVGDDVLIVQAEHLVPKVPVIARATITEGQGV